MKTSSLVRALVVLMVFCFCPVPGPLSPVTYSYAQSTNASVGGEVTDQQGRVVPGVTVVLTNLNTGITYEAKTNGDGFYNAPNLPPGIYRANVRKDGFKGIVKGDIELHVQDAASINFQLQVGSMTETVTVEGGAPLVNTENAAVSTVVDRRFVGNLPLNGRSFQSLILMTPGVVGTSSGGINPGEFSVNGQRQNANYFTVDGVSANTGVNPVTGGVAGFADAFSQQAGGAVPGLTAMGTTASLVSVDALEEFRIQTSTYSAEFGRQPGAQVQLVTRSGSNQFHGTLFEYLRNDAMDAQDWFNARIKLADEQAGVPFQKPELRQNQFGGTFSGPILKNRTFFFFSYEGQRLRIPQNFGAVTVPAVWLRKAAAPALQPLLNAFALPNGPDIQTLENPNNPFDPVTNPFVDSGFAPISAGFSSPSSVDAYSIRVDHSASDKLRLFGRYADTPSNSLTRFLSLLQGTVASSRTVTLGATFVATSRLSNEFRFNYSSTQGASSNSLDNFGGAVPITANQIAAPYSGPGPVQAQFVINFGSEFAFFIVGPFAANRQRQLDFVDNVLWAKGHHQLKFGIDWRHLTPAYDPSGYQVSISNPFSFFGTHTQFLQNVTSGTVDVFSSASKGARPIYNNVSTFVEDTWRLSPRLTLDLGLRWEVNPAPHDANGVKPVLIAGITGIDTSKATLAPPDTPFYRTNYTAFAPRVGVAYQLDQASGRETVLRAGFGVFYDLGSSTASSGFGTYPFSSSTFLPSVTLPLSPAQAQQPPFPTVVALPLNNVGALFALNPHLRLPYTLEWNVALERALGSQETLTLSYVASAGRRLTITQDLNAIPADAPQFTNQFRPNPNFGDIFFTRNAPTSDYQSFQAKFQRRLSHGLEALVSYTWSHAIDEASFDLDSFSTLQRSNAAFDVRHNLSVAATYDFPRLNGTGQFVGLMKGVANGWSIDSIFSARTGLPLDVTDAAASVLQARPNGNNVLIRPDVVPGQPIWISNPSAPGGQELNINAFTDPPFTVNNGPGFPVMVFQQGDLARNSIRLPGIYQLNMAVRRQFSLTERWKLQFKAEAFNLLNHPLFGNYDSLFFPGSPTFGQAQSMLSTAMGPDFPGVALNSLYQQGGPRSLQVSLRLSF